MKKFDFYYFFLINLVFSLSKFSTAQIQDAKQNVQCPYTPSIEQILKPVKAGDDEYVRTLGDYIKGQEDYILATSFRGDGDKNFQISLRNIHLDMRRNYDAMIRGVGNNIYPLIIASDQADPGAVSGIGGSFSLYLEDGTVKQITPTSPTFEMMKNLAHLPLGIFAILSPYFRVPRASGWRAPLRVFLDNINVAIEDATLSMDLSADMKERSIQMLKISARSISEWLQNPAEYKGVESFRIYSETIFPYVEKNIYLAAQYQASALLPELSKWKSELGPATWSRVHALIPTMWPVSAINPRLQILTNVMSAEQIRTQVIMVENGGNIQALRMTLGRVVADRAAALLIFGTNTQRGKTLTFNLSGKQDLLSTDFNEAIIKYNSNQTETPKMAKIRNLDNRQYLDVVSGTGEGNVVVLWFKTSDPWQKWELNMEHVENASPTRIAPIHQDGGPVKLLEEDRTTNKVAVWGDAMTYWPNQLWRFKKLSYGIYTIVNEATGRCLLGNGNGKQVTTEVCNFNNFKSLWEIEFE